MPINNELNPVLGIDLGTTFSSIARWDGNGAAVYQIGNDYDLQSAIYYDPDRGSFLVGAIAFNRGLVRPENMVLGFKRHMDNATQPLTIGGREFTPVELSARILEKLYGDVKDKFPQGKFESRGTVVTVPYYFKAHQCESTRLAAEMADIECIGIIQEPIAASLSYAWQMVHDHPEAESEETILVFDLGGGTFDLTLFNLKQSPDQLIFEVLATGGDDRLGGMDFDQSLIEFFLNKSNLSLEGMDPLQEKKARQKLRVQAIEAKIALSATPHTYVSVANLVGDQHLDIELTREEFEQAISSYTKKIDDIVDRIFITAGLAPSSVDRVIRVGGSSHIPVMKKLLENKIGGDKMYGNIDPSRCVAEGAALYAAYLDDKEVLKGRDMEILTRTCHALGVEMAGGVFHPIIPPNRKTPCETRMLFTNDQDNMEAIDIKVYQGSSKAVADNSLIGELSIPNLPQKPAGDLDIWVTFKVSEDQTLSVLVETEGMRNAAVLKFA